MWGTFLSEPLSIVALVGRYPANKLMERIPIPYRLEAFAGAARRPLQNIRHYLSFQKAIPE